MEERLVQNQLDTREEDKKDTSNRQTQTVRQLEITRESKARECKVELQVAREDIYSYLGNCRQMDVQTDRATS